MALPNNHPLDEHQVDAYYADVSTAGSTFVRAPFRGKIVKMGSVLHVAITGTDAAITTEINGTAVTGGSWTVTQSGSAAGDVDTAVPTAANVVNEDDVIEFISDGASSTTAPISYFAVIQAF